MRRLEPPGLIIDRPGKRALDVAEQLAFEQAFGQRSTVDADVGAVAARTEPVDGPGYQFLAGAGLAHDEHTGPGRCDQARKAVDLGHGLGAAYDVRQRGVGAVGI